MATVMTNGCVIGVKGESDAAIRARDEKSAF
jgi:hypothetical protein